MAVLLGANLLVRFLIELAALVALGAWGWRLPVGRPLRWVAAIASVAVAASVWAVFASPGAPVEVGPVGTAGVQIVVLAAAAVALVHLGRRHTAALFVTIALGNAALMSHWGQ